MEAIKIDTTEDKFIITIDKESVDAEFITRIVKLYKINQLASKGNLKKDILKIAEEIDSEWWEKNRETFDVKTGTP